VTETSKKRGLRGYRIIILALVGAALAIFGAVWSAVIFPSLDKVPLNYEKTLSFDGTFMVANPMTQSMDTIPISQTLEQKAVGTEDGALLIHEVRTVKNSVTGEVLPAIYNDETTLAIDRHTLMFVPDVDERGRTGYWGPPKGLGEGDSFDLWNPGAGRPLTARYARSENFRGIDVVVFTINESDINLGKEPQSGGNLLFTTTIKLWIEPSSGAVVNQESTTTTSIDMMGMKMPLQISTVNYAENTIVALMDTARSASWLLLWVKTLIPWIAICVGALLVIISGIIVAVRDLRKSRGGKRTQIQKPTSFPLDA